MKHIFEEQNDSIVRISNYDIIKQSVLEIHKFHKKEKKKNFHIYPQKLS